jgi:hypothetical protein
VVEVRVPTGRGGADLTNSIDLVPSAYQPNSNAQYGQTEDDGNFLEHTFTISSEVLGPRDFKKPDTRRARFWLESLTLVRQSGVARSTSLI